MTTPSGDLRTIIHEALEHLGHVLPGQAPLKDFVHHNTLHGLQHLPFEDAVAEEYRRTGNRGYLPAERFRAHYAAGRITREDLTAVLNGQADLDADAVLLDLGATPLHRRDLYLGALLHPLMPITGCQLAWQVEELNALAAFQPDVPPESRERLLARARADGRVGDAAAIADLWTACLSVLGLEHYIQHPEELLDLSPGQAERLLAAGARGGAKEHPGEPQGTRIEASALLADLLARVGHELTLGDLLRRLTGEDLAVELLPLVSRWLGAYLDQGAAPWSPGDAGTGFYAAWRRLASADATPLLLDLRAWSATLDALPEDPVDALVAELKRLGLTREQWSAYLERLALATPGWSGMVLWREQHRDYEGLAIPVALADYLAVLLVLEHLFADRLCRRLWQIEATLDMLRWYFRRNGAELMVRHALFAEDLPEYLASRAARAVAASDLSPADRGWDGIAELIRTWRKGPTADRPQGYTVLRSAWPLFRLAQHLGLAGADLRALDGTGVAAVFDCLGRLTESRASHLWLLAYERHYREQVLTVLAHNHGRGRWSTRPAPPAAQVMLCMDDREEGLRRHLEELAPEIETLGAAAHYCVPHNWRGLDDTQVTALAPVIPAPMIPAHEVHEQPRPECEAAGPVHRRRHAALGAWYEGLMREGRRGVLVPAAAMVAGAPLALASLLGEALAPAAFDRLVAGLRRCIEGPVATHVRFTAPADSPPARPERPRLGYTDQEQAERVFALLSSAGLTDGFAPLVAILGHGSRNRNNPHASAYNCGACSGRFSGPNARLVAAMANRGKVRALLAERSVRIPDGTWLVGGEHDTCSDRIDWYDTEDIPTALAPAFATLCVRLDEASALHAHERCRRFASAPAGLSPAQALRHVADRAGDYSQPRPELGHATNACALVGRRSMSRGAFFDRRAFLISYDPARDPDGTILERHLVTNGAVGAGISLEYYFSTVDNAGHGAGTKVTHNVTGWHGVMQGTASDLSTGLPAQMIEIHEPMRLLVVVEQATEVLTAIYQRQPAIRELVGNGWVQLAAKHPDTGTIHLFDPAEGWIPWNPSRGHSPRQTRSADCYAGQTGACAPALVLAPDEA